MCLDYEMFIVYSISIGVDWDLWLQDGLKRCYSGDHFLTFSAVKL